MPIKHIFQSGRGDNGDPGAVQPSHWNAPHELTGMLAALDALAPTPNVFFSFDGGNTVQLVAKSTIATTFSPAFTGVPTAPTPSQSVNSTQVATTEFVQTAITNLIGGAPGALNTLKELADAINDDGSYAATISAALGVRLRVDAAQGLNSTQQSQGVANLGLATVATSGSYSDLTSKPTLGTAAALNTGTTANSVVKLDGSAKLPAVDGSQLTNLPSVASEPVGAVSFHSGTAAPTNKIKANGALLSRTTFATLWAYAQSSGNLAASDGAWQKGQYSPGDGSTTFRIPDLRGIFIRGFDDSAGVDSGRTFGSYQTDAFQGHFHQLTGILSSTGSFAFGAGGSGITTSTSLAISDGTNGTPRTAAETRPINAALLACIKYQ